MSKNISGLQQDSKTKQWSIDKRIKGYGRVRQRLQARTAEEAKREFYNITARIISAMKRKQEGVMTVRDGFERYFGERKKRSIDRDMVTAKKMAPFIGDIPLDQIDNRTMKAYVKSRTEQGIKKATLVRDFAVLSSMLDYLHRSCRTEFGRPCLEHAIKLVYESKDNDASIPYPLTQNEQKDLFKNLPEYLEKMCIFGVNTGVRVQGICNLKWDWEIDVPSLNASVFIIPDSKEEFSGSDRYGSKNHQDQLVVLNKEARAVIDAQRGMHDEYVFPYKGRRLGNMNNSAWRTAWRKTGLPIEPIYKRGPHNLRHTFGGRLSEDVPLETRKKLLSHKNGGVTLTYSPVAVKELLNAVENISGKGGEIVRKKLNKKG
ncbi:tyrosine-type recombinase/integrase [Methylobacter psychrophilus]|uniref:tyrosine-type recombinase/integrase n=1 Tax=Methylobacter psychrophilus TaxID=96941 RepID=UPI0021D48AA0|nr:tyrosine-type recombinase/integrase [Methylobacter psychrophilus]